MKVVLDTHALVWWVNGSISPETATLIESAEEVVISTISTWEIAMLVKKGRLRLGSSVDVWIDKVAAVGNVTFQPVSNRVALESNSLPGEIHGDPADRIITAQARLLSIPLLTADKKLIEYPHVETIKTAEIVL